MSGQVVWRRLSDGSFYAVPTPERHAEMASLFFEGWTPAALGERYGVSAGAIKAKLKSLGLLSGAPHRRVPRYSLMFPKASTWTPERQYEEMQREGRP